LIISLLLVVAVVVVGKLVVGVLVDFAPELGYLLLQEQRTRSLLVAAVLLVLLMPEALMAATACFQALLLPAVVEALFMICLVVQWRVLMVDLAAAALPETLQLEQEVLETHLL